jgi:uncharacterized protein
MMPLTIVLINHSVNGSLLYRAIFAARGHRVLAFGQDVTTLAEVQALHPHLLIIDGVRGYVPEDLDMLATLQHHPRLKCVPVVVTLTTQPAMLPPDMRHALGKAQVLVKPFSCQALLDCTTQALQGHRVSA